MGRAGHAGLRNQAPGGRSQVERGAAVVGPDAHHGARPVLADAAGLHCRSGAEMTRYRLWRSATGIRTCRKVNCPAARIPSGGRGQPNGPRKLNSSGPHQTSNQQAWDSNGSARASPLGPSRQMNSHPCSSSQPTICRSSGAKESVQAFMRASVAVQNQRPVCRPTKVRS